MKRITRRFRDLKAGNTWEFDPLPVDYAKGLKPYSGPELTPEILDLEGVYLDEKWMMRRKLQGSSGFVEGTLPPGTPTNTSRVLAVIPPTRTFPSSSTFLRIPDDAMDLTEDETSAGEGSAEAAEVGGGEGSAKVSSGTSTAGPDLCRPSRSADAGLM